MSVINQMLRDLDNNSQPNNKSLDMQAVVDKTSRRSGVNLSFILLVILSVAVVYLLVKIPSLKPVLLHSQENIDAATMQPSQLPLSASKMTKEVSEEKMNMPELASNPLGNKNTDAVDTRQIAPEKTPVVATKYNSSIETLDKITINTKPLAQIADIAPETRTRVTAVTPGKKAEISNSSVISTSAKSSHETIIQHSTETRLKKQLQQIQIAARLQAYQKSKSELLSLLAENPDFHQARLYLIQLAQKNRDPQLADLFLQSLAAYPKISAYRIAAARYFFQMKDYQRAENILNDIHNDLSNYFELLQIRALTRQQINKHQQAIADYAIILKNEPNRGDIFIALGISFEALGEIIQAKRSFQNALSDQRLTRQQQAFAESKINQYQG